MSDMVQPSATPGLFARAIGMVVSPSDTFRALLPAPRSVGILFLVCLVMGLAAGAPQMTATGRQATLDMQVQQTERFTGQAITPEQYAAMESRAWLGPYLAFGGTFIAIPFFTVLFTAIYWAIFNIVLGGTATFGQVLAVNSHSQVIGAIGAVAAVPIQLMQGVFTPSGPFNLGALLPMLEPTSALALFLGGIGFFGIWQTVVGGLGLGVLYKRPATLFVVVLLLIYFAITAIFSVGLSSFMGR